MKNGCLILIQKNVQSQYSSFNGSVIKYSGTENNSSYTNIIIDFARSLESKCEVRHSPHYSKTQSAFFFIRYHSYSRWNNFWLHYEKFYWIRTLLCYASMVICKTFSDGRNFEDSKNLSLRKTTSWIWRWVDLILTRVLFQQRSNLKNCSWLKLFLNLYYRLKKYNFKLVAVNIKLLHLIKMNWITYVGLYPATYRCISILLTGCQICVASFSSQFQISQLVQILLNPVIYSRNHNP